MKQTFFAALLAAVSLAQPAQAQKRWWECAVEVSFTGWETVFSVWRRGNTSSHEKVAVSIQMARYSGEPDTLYFSLFGIKRWKGINEFNGKWTNELPIKIASIQIDDGAVRRLEFLSSFNIVATSRFVHDDAVSLIRELENGDQIAWEAQPVFDSEGPLFGSESLLGFTAAARECGFIE